MYTCILSMRLTVNNRRITCCGLVVIDTVVASVCIYTAAGIITVLSTFSTLVYICKVSYNLSYS